MNKKPDRQVRSFNAFSLLEVVVAIGIFATGIVTVVALFGVLAKSVGANAEATAAGNLGDLLQEYLQSRVAAEGSLEPIARLMPAAANNATASPGILYAGRDGTAIGENADPVFGEDGRDKFFAITLLPTDGNGASPALVIPYVAQVRWPAFGQGGTGEPVPVPGASQQQVLLVGAVSR